MKIKIILSLLVFSLLTIAASAQQAVLLSSAAYDSVKAVDPDYLRNHPIVINGAQQGNVIQPVIQPAGQSKVNGCNLLQDITDANGNLTDNTYSVVPFTGGVAPEYRCDDCATNSIQLPFDFCFFGQTFNNIFISSNGKIDFGTAFGDFTPDPTNTYPLPAYTFVAPFWSDIDIRANNSGLVYYKITPTRCIVQWNRVSYYEGGSTTAQDKVNTFQVIITNGADPILPGTANVAFSYGDMQWAVGSTQGGTNGFDPSPNLPAGDQSSVVGSNIANPLNFIMFARMAVPGSGYDGPYNNDDGIDWLDDRDIIFDNCNASSNIPPIPSTTATCNGVQDTICQGETAPFTFSFFAPEQNQTVNITLNPASAPGLTYSVTQNGAIATVTGTFVGNPNNIGTNSFTVLATDDGTPAQTTVVPLVFQVNNVNIAPQITATDDTICPGQNTTLALTNTYNSYIWQPGTSTQPSITISAAGQYVVTVTEQGCSASDTIQIYQYAPVPLTITGANSVCSSGLVTLQASPNFTNYVWTNSASTTDTANVHPGTYSVSGIDPNGCPASSSPFVVSPTDPVVTIIGPTDTCFSANVNLSAVVLPPANNYNYSWTGSADTDADVSVGPGTYTVTVTDISGLCSSTATFTVTDHNPDVQIINIIPFCEGEQILITTDSAFTTYQWYDDGVAIPGNNFAYANGGEYVVVVTDPFGCQAVDTAQITPIPPPTAAFATIPAFGGVQFEPVQFNDQSTPANYTPIDSIISWEWSFGVPPSGGLPTSSTDQNPSSTFNVTGPQDVTLIITTEEGCKDTITVAVEIVPDIAPDVITPNGDGVNDFFVLPVAYVKPNCQMFIYNRWGKKVYESASYANDWDGEGHTDGVYYFTFFQPDGKEHHGTVTILTGK